MHTLRFAQSPPSISRHALVIIYPFEDSNDIDAPFEKINYINFLLI